MFKLLELFFVFLDIIDRIYDISNFAKAYILKPIHFTMKLQPVNLSGNRIRMIEVPGPGLDTVTGLRLGRESRCALINCRTSII